MLLSLKFLKGLELNLKLRSVIGTIPFYLTRENTPIPKFVPCISTKLKWQWSKMSITSVLVGLLWYQVLKARSTERLITTLESGMIVFSVTIFLLINCVYLKRNEFLIKLFNSFIQYEHSQSLQFTGIISKREKIVTNYIQLNGFMAAPVIATTYLAQRWINPCTSATLAWNYLEECFDKNRFENGYWSFKSYTYLVIMVLILWWILADLLVTFAFQAAEIMYLQSACLVGYVKHFKEQLKISAVTSPKVILKYRQLQILTKYYNWIQQDAIIALMLTLVICLTVVSSYVIIKMGSHVSPTHFLFFWCALVDALAAIIVIYGEFASLHTQSRLVLTMFRSQVIPTLTAAKFSSFKQKLIRKYVATFYPLNVQLGSVNFVDKMTPIVLLQFCVEQLANLLLLE
ncbi:unnamed protein product [Orchesella dallaii]|uniref:Gustatory receptor n=1 Tax=Orchesella dallaii TaxID=48710 RepID=A0ABP1QD41_9HEXA